jgi:cyclopropane fatty-acyl-phospholipid synthase-like methyltransferase
MHPSATGLLKAYARNSPALIRLTHRLRGFRKAGSLEELDALFDGAMEGNREVTLDVYRKLVKIWLEPPKDLPMPADPFSKAYADRQDELYRRVANKSYATVNEATPFDFERDKDNFFPYNTQSPEFVGLQLQSQGFLVRNLGIKPGARIVEFGAGWGNWSMHLAMMGYDVTAVEVNKPSIALMQYRAGLHGRNIRTAEQDMVEFAKTTGERFDAALFVACFHHCHDHMGMLESLGRIIKDDGVVYFHDEPIAPAPSPTQPYPWGLRLDGNSLYYTRRWGWLEMGFQEGYFREALRRSGWRVEVVRSTVNGVEDLFIARKPPKGAQA